MLALAVAKRYLPATVSAETAISQARLDVLDGRVPGHSDDIPIAPTHAVYDAFAKYFNTLAAADGLQNANERTSAQLDAVTALANSFAESGANLVQLGQR